MGNLPLKNIIIIFEKKKATLALITCSLDSAEYSRDVETELFNFENYIKFNTILK